MSDVQTELVVRPTELLPILLNDEVAMVGPLNYEFRELTRRQFFVVCGAPEPIGFVQFVGPDVHYDGNTPYTGSEVNCIPRPSKLPDDLRRVVPCRQAMAVLPEYRHRGLALSMLTLAIAIDKELHDRDDHGFFVKVFEDPANESFRRMGFDVRRDPDCGNTAVFDTYDKQAPDMPIYWPEDKDF